MFHLTEAMLITTKPENVKDKNPCLRVLMAKYPRAKTTAEVKKIALEEEKKIRRARATHEARKKLRRDVAEILGVPW